MFIWLQHTGSLVAACELLGHVGSFPDQGLNLGPLHWERGAFAPRLPKKSLISISDVWKLRFGEVRELASGPWKWEPAPPRPTSPHHWVDPGIKWALADPVSLNLLLTLTLTLTTPRPAEQSLGRRRWGPWIGRHSQLGGPHFQWKGQDHPEAPQTCGHPRLGTAACMRCWHSSWLPLVP